MGDWSDWTECSQTCGDGTQTHTRDILTPANDGGKACDETEESQKCNIVPCQEECVMSDWSDWTECSQTCGGGSQSHSRTVVAAGSGGEEGCPPLEEAQDCNTEPCEGISVTKTPNPSCISEIGGDVVFTVRIENEGPDPVTLESLMDDVYGDLSSGACPDNTCKNLIGTVIPGGESIECDFAALVHPFDPTTLTNHLNTVTATAATGRGTTLTGAGSAEVCFNAVAPAVAVTKTANPTHVAETGELVDFTVRVQNLATEMVTIQSLDDDKFGNLFTADPQNSCSKLASATIPGIQFVECHFTRFIKPSTQSPNQDHIDTVTATVRDRQGNPAQGSDSVTVTFDAVSDVLKVTKTPDLDKVSELGGDVIFTVRIQNTKSPSLRLVALDDDMYGDLFSVPNSQCSTLRDINIGNGEMVGCTFTRFVTPPNVRTLADHVNRVTATARPGGPGTNNLTGFDSARVGFIDILPEIHVNKTATPTTAKASGEEILFKVAIQNKKPENVTVHSITDSVFGDLFTRKGNNTCRDLANAIILGNKTAHCHFTAIVTPLSKLEDHVDNITVIVQDRQLNRATASASATVKFEGKLEVNVTKTPHPTFVDEDGGNVTFTVRIENKANENVTLSALHDDIFGDLFTRSGNNTCKGLSHKSIPANDVVTCQFTAFVIPQDQINPLPHNDTVTATIKAHNLQATGNGSATVKFGWLPALPPEFSFRFAENAVDPSMPTLYAQLRPQELTESIAGLGKDAMAFDGIWTNSDSPQDFTTATLKLFSKDTNKERDVRPEVNVYKATKGCPNVQTLQAKLEMVDFTGFSEGFFGFHFWIDTKPSLGYIVSPAGVSIKDGLDNLDNGDRYKILLDVAQGLKCITERGYYHLDVNLDNIIVSDDGQTRIIGLGDAKKPNFAIMDICHRKLGYNDILYRPVELEPALDNNNIAKCETLVNNWDSFSFGMVLHFMGARGEKALGLVSSLVGSNPPTWDSVVASLTEAYEASLLTVPFDLDWELDVDPDARAHRMFVQQMFVEKGTA